MLCARTRRGLPFPCLALIKLLLGSALARAQRDSKVTICHYVWMQNHLHMLLVAHDAHQARNFYMEVQKKITDYMKKLLGKEQLTLWSGRPSVAEIMDIPQAMHEIAYYYLNPARANLVEDIEDYPGLTSWSAFNDCLHQGVQSFASSVHPWVRQPTIPLLPGTSLSERQDRFLTEKLIRKAKTKHELTIHPNAWMKCFGIGEQSEITTINDAIKDRISRTQAELSERRAREGKKVIGAYRLKTAAISFEHTPKEKTRRIYVLASTVEARIARIRYVQSIVALCKELYKRACAGEWVQWPPGVFVPPLPPRASAVSFP